MLGLFHNIHSKEINSFTFNIQSFYWRSSAIIKPTLNLNLKNPIIVIKSAPLKRKRKLKCNKTNNGIIQAQEGLSSKRRIVTPSTSYTNNNNNNNKSNNNNNNRITEEKISNIINNLKQNYDFSVPFNLYETSQMNNFIMLIINNYKEIKNDNINNTVEVEEDSEENSNNYNNNEREEEEEEEGNSNNYNNNIEVEEEGEVEKKQQNNNDISNNNNEEEGEEDSNDNNHDSNNEGEAKKRRTK